MLAGEYYDKALADQRQTSQEQTKIIAEIKALVSISGDEQIKALQDGFAKLSRAIGNIEIPSATGATPSRSIPNVTHITIQSQYYDYYWSWYWQWWNHYYNS